MLLGLLLLSCFSACPGEGSAWEREDKQHEIKKGKFSSLYQEKNFLTGRFMRLWRSFSQGKPRAFETRLNCGSRDANRKHICAAGELD